MALSNLEIIALILVILTIVKIAVISINKKVWYEKIAKPIYIHNRIGSFLLFVLSVIIFYFLLAELSIIAIFAVMALMACLLGFGVMQYHNELLQMINKLCKEKIKPMQWFYIIIWLSLSLWALYEILFL